MKYGFLTLELNESKTEYTVVSCDKEATSVTVPVKIDGVPVTEIGENAFEDCATLENVIFEEPTMDDVFSEAVFKRVGNYAFEGCISLKSIELPFTLQSLGRGSFCDCASCERAIYPSKAYIGPYAFYRCKSLMEAGQIDGYINEGAFSMCESLEKLPVNENTKEICEDAFEHCYALKSVVIPKSITRIEALAFRSCFGLEKVTFERTDGWRCGNRYRDYDVEIDVTNAEKNARSLREMDFDDGVTAWYVKK